MVDRAKTALVLSVLCVLLAAVIVCEGRVSRSRSCTRVHAALRMPNEQQTTVFFNDREYIRYSHSHEAEADVRRLRRLGLQGTIRAAYTDLDSSVVILESQTFKRYNVSESDVLTELHSGDVTQLGLPHDVDAAVTWNEQILAFKGCEVFGYDVESSQFQSGGDVSELGLPCDIDAAVEWTYDSVLFIKGHNYWVLSSFGEVDGPRHTDELNICSWYLCGEADWMRERLNTSQLTACNGDIRLCPLRLDQVTLPGLHNAGSGFAGGFGLLNCWLRNHGKSIKEQLELGIRHLDVDPCYEKCGLLGSCHTIMCGGSICRMLKQVRHFMKENRQEVLTINFNHEVVDKGKVFKALTRQIKTQLGPVLNKRYRTRHNVWPTMKNSIMTSRRLFVIYAYEISRNPEFNRLYYSRNKWIHTEDFYRSTWVTFHLDNDKGCQPLVSTTWERCYIHQYASLLEVSVIPETRGSCTHTMADACTPYQHDLLKICESARFNNSKSPNVLLVDWPEINSDGASSVFNAVKQQNVRNIHRHRPADCHVTIDSAIRLGNSSRVVLWSGREMVVYDMVNRQEVSRRPIWTAMSNVTASYYDDVTGRVVVFEGCERKEFDPALFQLENLDNAEAGDYLLSTRRESEACSVEAAVMWNGQTRLFTGCEVRGQGQESLPLSQPLSQWGLPCHIDAAFAYESTLYLFKGDNYHTRSADIPPSQGKILDWNLDVLQC